MAGNLSVAALGERDIIVTRDFDAGRQYVFPAMTDADQMKRWLFGPEEWPLAHCVSEAVEGGALRLIWRRRDGRELGMSGTYREVIPPERLVHTELFDEDWTGGQSLVTTVLAASGSGTSMAMSIRYSSRAARDNALATTMRQGLELCYTRLAALVEGGFPTSASGPQASS